MERTLNNQMKWNEPTTSTPCVASKRRLRILICQPIQSYSKHFFMSVLVMTQNRIILRIMIHIRWWTGRTFCNLHVADIWFMPAKAFPQEEVFWLISIVMSWGHFPFCDLIRPHNKTEPNMFGIWLGDLMETCKGELHEVLPVNQQECSVLDLLVNKCT